MRIFSCPNAHRAPPPTAGVRPAEDLGALACGGVGAGEEAPEGCGEPLGEIQVRGPGVRPHRQPDHRPPLHHPAQRGARGGGLSENLLSHIEIMQMSRKSTGK